MGRKSTACHNCKSIKSLCTKDTPCARCKRLSLFCSYGTSNDQNQIASSRSVEAGKKAKHKKTTTGCLSCRRRRKKCDEKWPVCTDCERLHLTCVQVDVHDKSTQPETTLSCITDEFLTSYAFQTWAAPGNHEDHSLSILSSFPDWLALIESDNQHETARIARLDNSTALTSLGLPCAIDDELGLATFLPSTALNNLTGVTPHSLKDWPIAERHYLNHFLQSVSRALVLVEDRLNPFLHMIVPMALENVGVRHALLALSTCHLSKVYPDFEHDLCVHRSKALQELIAELDNREDPIWPLATTLMLCLAEVGTQYPFDEMLKTYIIKDLHRNFTKMAASSTWSKIPSDST